MLCCATLNSVEACTARVLLVLVLPFVIDCFVVVALYDFAFSVCSDMCHFSELSVIDLFFSD